MGFYPVHHNDNLIKRLLSKQNQRALVKNERYVSKGYLGKRFQGFKIVLGATRLLIRIGRLRGRLRPCSRLSKMKDGDADGVAVRIPGAAAVGRRRILILTIAAAAISFCRDV